ncbi:MAG TPA: hypothetical protein VMS21_07395 [Methylomirabilota bacterium]|nr:hypothetical protein [Methylomirabilota bacterium]
MKTPESLSLLENERKIGTEPFTTGGEPLGFHAVSFWQWAHSDLSGHLIRGVLAEYLVAEALGVATGVRDPSLPFDLRSPGGLQIEVKSAASLQSSSRREPSTISFSIRETRAWDSAANEMSEVSSRQADLYVFALLAHRDPGTLNPLELSQWEFYLLPAETLADREGSRKLLTLQSLLLLGPERATFEGLAGAVRRFEDHDQREPAGVGMAGRAAETLSPDRQGGFLPVHF